MAGDLAKIRAIWAARHEKAQKDRAEAEERIANAQSVLKALEILAAEGIALPMDTHGVAASQNSPLAKRIRNLVETRSGTFTNANVRGWLGDKTNRMSVRTVLSELVDQGILRIARPGSRGIATVYERVN